MQTDSLTYDSLNERPLPKWLIDQKTGFTCIEPEELVMKEDHSLKISFFVTGIFIILLVVLLTLLINRKYKNQAL